MFMVLSSWHSHCESSPGSFDECRLSARWPPILRPNQPIWAVSPPKDWLLPSADTIAIYYYYSARKLILILHSTEGGRLSNACLNMYVRQAIEFCVLLLSYHCVKLMIKWLWVWLLATSRLYSGLWACCSHTCPSHQKYNVVLAEMHWCSAAGRVTAGLVASNLAYWWVYGLTALKLGSALAPISICEHRRLLRRNSVNSAWHLVKFCGWSWLITVTSAVDRQFNQSIQSIYLANCATTKMNVNKTM